MIEQPNENKLENTLSEQKNTEKCKYLQILGLVSSIVLFSVSIVGFVVNKQTTPIIDYLPSLSVQSMTAFDLYKNSNEERTISSSYLNKAINQFESVPLSSQRLSLLFLVGQTNIFVQSNQSELAVRYFLQNTSLTPEQYRSVEGNPQFQFGGFDKEQSERYLKTLVSYYKNLSLNKIPVDNFIANNLNSYLQDSDLFIDNKILLSLYSLEQNIQHRDDIKKILSDNFSFNDFASNPEEYWKTSKYSKEYGTEIPEFLKAFFKLNIPQETLDNFLKRY